jgi:KDO2-lipid IV(A) lauroyltransferase
MRAQASTDGAAPPESSFWIRWVSRLPWGFLYALATGLAFLVSRVVRYRRSVVDRNLARAFPGVDAAQRRRWAQQHYAGTLDMIVEVIKIPSLTAAELRRRVRFVNLGQLQDSLAAGRPVLGVAAHQCNWEWILQALAVDLGFPIDVAYKPLKDRWSERQFLALRSRLGCRMVPAKSLLAEVIRLRQQVRAIMMVADQEPVTAERKHWLKFLGTDTAFYPGAEEIVRAMHFEALFVGMRRVSRGHYQVYFEPLASAHEPLRPGEFTERYARAVERQVLAAPPDWLWSHRRWKLKKPFYTA